VFRCVGGHFTGSQECLILRAFVYKGIQVAAISRIFSKLAAKSADFIGYPCKKNIDNADKLVLRQAKMGMGWRKISSIFNATLIN